MSLPTILQSCLLKNQMDLIDSSRFIIHFDTGEESEEQVLAQRTLQSAMAGKEQAVIYTRRTFG